MQLHRVVLSWLQVTAASLAVLLAGCAADPPLGLELAPDVIRPAKSVVILWADGVDHQRFDELMAAGRLPNIKRVFVDGGVSVESGVDCLPSQTYVNGASMITGQFSGHHGIAGNLWLDRQTFESIYYLTLPTYLDSNRHMVGATMYDLLADHFTLNIHCHTRRGVSQTIDQDGLPALCFVLGAFITSDRLMADRLVQAAAIANQVKRWPSVIMMYCSGVDEIGHHSGPNSPQYLEALENVDHMVGRISEAIRSAGLADRTYFILVSDHGMLPMRHDRTMHLQQWLRSQRHLGVRCEPLTGWDYNARLRELDRCDVFLAVGSDRAAAIHLRGQRGWTNPPEPAEIEAFVLASPSLIDLPAVDCVVMRAGPDRVNVLSSRGSAVIERQIDGRRRLYRVTEQSGDPLDCGQDTRLAAMAASGWHESRKWFEATAQTSHPDFVPQVAEMFDSPRMGDCVLFAADEAAFSQDWLGGHGSCLRRDMHVVQLYAGPDLPAGTSIPCSRLVDVAPTVIGLLGEAGRLKNYPPMDGIDLSGQLKTASRLTTAN
jgi:hypothetical protein